MKAVLIGDIGWPDLYHLGDEAMTEAAIDMLRERGIDDITLVAGDPAVAEAFYGLPAVRRVRFRGDWSRARNEWRLADVARVLREEDWHDHPIYPAIRDADVLVIAGGGNMNSRDDNLLFERVAAMRIAKHFHTPLYVTSQTVGPRLDDPDRALIVEMLEYATAFGAREQSTYDLLRELAPDPSTVFRTLDDGIVLTADEAARTAARDIAGERPYLAASFTWHEGVAWPGVDAYYADLGQLCAGIVDRLDLDVLLIPHAGSLNANAPLALDQRANELIAAAANTPRVRSTRQVTAREDVALIEGAVASLSTRYHPTVFAPPALTPAVAIAPSTYSWTRMRGSLANTGLGAFVVPAPSCDLVLDALAEACHPDSDVRDAVAHSGATGRALQTQWWDAIATSITTGEPVQFTAALDATAYTPHGEWSARNQDRAATAVALLEQQEHTRALRRLLSSTRAELDATRTKQLQASDALQRLKRRKVVRVIDRLTR